MQTLERVAEILVTMSEFGDLLDLETAAVRAANTQAIEKLAERKEFLALHYQRQLRMLSDRQADLAELDPAIRQRLAQACRAFSLRQNENATALDVARNATRHVVELIVTAIREAEGTRRDNAYASPYRHGPYAGASATHATSAQACVSVTYNRVL